MGEVRVELREAQKGINGGKYWWLFQGERMVPTSSLASPVSQVDKDVTYSLTLPADAMIAKFDFSNRGNLSAHLFRADGVRVGHEAEMAWISCENVGAQVLMKRMDASVEIRGLAEELRRIVESVRGFYHGNVQAIHSKGTTQTEMLFKDIDQAILMSLVQGKGAAKSLGLALKTVKQFCEVKALADGLGAKVAEGHIGRRWKGHSRLPFLKIGTGRPNFILEAPHGEYSVWIEFEPVRDIRPDLFVLKGRHDSAYDGGVEDVIEKAARDPKFVELTEAGWRRAWASSMGVAATPGADAALAEAEVVSFVCDLVSHLKSGLVVESKENGEDGVLHLTANDQEQLERYKALLGRHRLALLSWPGRAAAVDGFAVIEGFGVDTWSAGLKLAEMARALPARTAPP